QSGVSRELFPRETGYVFDPAAAAATAAQLTVGELLDPRRAARLNNQTMVSETLPDFAEVLREGREHLWAAPSDGARGIVERRVQVIWVNELGALVSNENAAAQVRADAMLSLTEIAEDAQKQVRSRDSGWRAHGLLIEHLIQGFVASDRPIQVAPVKVPPGSPI
ncbi:MAG: peptidase, partial [Luminiphilus sp.]